MYNRPLTSIVLVGPSVFYKGTAIDYAGNESNTYSKKKGMTMGSEVVRYAIGEFGALSKFTGKDVPAGQTALVEEDGKTLTEKGLTFCKNRGIQSPNVEVIRVLCDQYAVPAMVQAVEAINRNAELINERYEQTKISSEKLRLDWEAQDKAYQAAEAAKKKAAAAAKTAASAPPAADAKAAK